MTESDSPPVDSAVIRDRLERALNRASEYEKRFRPALTYDIPSDLSMDNDALAPFSQSDAVLSGLASAADQLGALRSLLATDSPRLFAPYSLVRVSLEMASTAMWLLLPDDPKVRRMRRLALEIRHTEDFGKIAKDIPDPTVKRDVAKYVKDQKENIYKVAAANGINEYAMNKLNVSATGILEYASPFVVAAHPQLRADEPFVVRHAWRETSGIVHGRGWALERNSNVSDSYLIGSRTPVRLFGPMLTMLNDSVQIAVTTLIHAFRILDTRISQRPLTDQ